jgi:hypothetical protein
LHNKSIKAKNKNASRRWKKTSMVWYTSIPIKCKLYESLSIRWWFWKGWFYRRRNSQFKSIDIKSNENLELIRWYYMSREKCRSGSYFNGVSRTANGRKRRVE